MICGGTLGSGGGGARLAGVEEFLRDFDDGGGRFGAG